jgi:hypothetical protein
MSGNTFGTLFAVTNFGESHGPAIGCVIDGCPPGMDLCEAGPAMRTTPIFRNTASVTLGVVAVPAPA